jgi:pyrroloquinoline quinone (PQQ) biosynthesis protein C
MLSEFLLIKIHKKYKGELSMKALQIYAKEYYGRAAAFPRYIGMIHSSYKNIEDR